MVVRKFQRDHHGSGELLGKPNFLKYPPIDPQVRKLGGSIAQDGLELAQDGATLQRHAPEPTHIGTQLPSLLRDPF